jgi:hypothetical protein
VLLRTDHGTAILKDWHPDLIGRAYRSRAPRPGEGMDAIQVLLLKKPAAPLPEPRPVPVLDNVEKLADFHNR